MIITQSLILNYLLFCFCVGDFVDFHAPMYILHAHIAYHEPRTHATNDK